MVSSDAEHKHSMSSGAKKKWSLNCEYSRRKLSSLANRVKRFSRPLPVKRFLLVPEVGGFVFKKSIRRFLMLREAKQQS